MTENNLFNRIRTGLAKTRDNISGKLNGVMQSFKKVDEDFYGELEEALILCDLGVRAVTEIIEDLRQYVKRNKVTETQDVKAGLVNIIENMLKAEEGGLACPCVMLVVGVNGVGKTTAIGKLAHYYKNSGRSVMVAAADTFRAAAAEQLAEWASRAQVPIVKYGEGADPAAVVYDAIDSAKHRNIDLLIVDTAGRLHNRKNLMNELRKIKRVVEKSYPEAAKETYLVVDATTEQNAIVQAKIFSEAADLTGLILTKLDGTAKGGVICAIKKELGLPVRFIGIGEGIGDLQPFNARAFTDALMG